MRAGALLVAAVAMLAGPALTAPLACRIDQKFTCTREGCVPALAGSSFSRIDFERGIYALCDYSGCDEYPATIWRGGVYINIELRGHSAFAKLSDTRNDQVFADELQALHLLEVTSTGLITLVSYGTCTEDRR